MAKMYQIATVLHDVLITVVPPEKVDNKVWLLLVLSNSSIIFPRITQLRMLNADSKIRKRCRGEKRTVQALQYSAVVRCWCETSNHGAPRGLFYEDSHHLRNLIIER